MFGRKPIGQEETTIMTICLRHFSSHLGKLTAVHRCFLGHVLKLSTPSKLVFAGSSDRGKERLRLGCFENEKIILHGEMQLIPNK